jgi:hypothetical protein
MLSTSNRGPAAALLLLLSYMTIDRGPCACVGYDGGARLQQARASLLKNLRFPVASAILNLSQAAENQVQRGMGEL